MKLVTLAFIAAFGVGAAAQNSSVPNPSIELLQRAPASQAGCPVAFTDVALKSEARYLPVKADAPDGSLAFQYKNQSGKPIQSIAVQVELKVKRSIYDLDATTITRDMTLTGQGSEAILPLNLFVYGLGRVTLQQVVYADGATWTPKTSNACSYEQPGSAERIAR